MTPISAAVSGSDAFYQCITLSYLDGASTRHYCSACPIEDDLADDATELPRNSKNIQLPYTNG